MAGGWAEVFAVGSWIGTGTRTGGKLNKYGEEDEAPEDKKGAGETAEGNKGRARPLQCKQTVFG
jgi:hypothetical protein